MARKINGAIGFGGQVYRAGQEEQFEDAMKAYDSPAQREQRQKKGKADGLDVKRLEASGAYTGDATKREAPETRNLQLTADGTPADKEATKAAEAEAEAARAASGQVAAESEVETSSSAKKSGSRKSAKKGK